MCVCVCVWYFMCVAFSFPFQEEASIENVRKSDMDLQAKVLSLRGWKMMGLKVCCASSRSMWLLSRTRDPTLIERMSVFSR